MNNKRFFPLVGRDFGFGQREDGTNKGLGFFGMLPRPDGKMSSELSFSIDTGTPKELFAPLIVPTLNKHELNLLLSGSDPTHSILQKAIAHALMRKGKGMSPFASPGEQQKPPSFFIPDMLRRP